MCESIGQFLATRSRPYVNCDPPGDDDTPNWKPLPEPADLEIPDAAGDVVDPGKILSGLNLRG